MGDSVSKQTPIGLPLESPQTWELLRHLGDIAASDAPLAHSGRKISALLAKSLDDVASCSILLFSHHSQRLELLAACGREEALGLAPPASRNQGLAFLEGEGVAGAAFREQSPVFWDEDCSRADLLLRRPGLTTPHSLASLPLVAGGRRLGVLNLSFHEALPFGPERRERLVALGRAAANTLCILVMRRELADRHDDSDNAARDALSYRSIIEQSPLGLFSVDSLRGEVVWANRAARTLLARKGELKGLKLNELFSGSLADDALARNMLRVLGRGQSFHEMRLRLPLAAGEHRWLSLSMEPVRDAAGEVFEGHFTAFDVTGTQRAALALWQEKERFRILAQEAPLGIVLMSPDGVLEYANPKFTEIFGYTLKDLPTGRQWLHKAYPDRRYRKQVIKAWLDDLKEAGVGESRPRIFEVTCRDGRRKTIHFRSVSLVDGKQLIFYEDISERQLAAEELARSEQRYRQLFDNVYDFICMHDLEGRFLSMNLAARMVLNLRPEEIIRRLVSDFIPERLRNEFHTSYMEKVLNEGHAEGVAIFRDTRGEEHYLEYRNLLVSPPGEQPYVIGVGRDVTERIQNHQRLKRLQDQLAQSQRMEALGTLASGISHDFNNLLQAMSGHLELMRREGGLSPDQGRHLEQIAGAVERAAALVRQVLTFSRRVQPSAEHLDLNMVVRQSVAILERAIPRMIEIRTALTSAGAWVHADLHQLEQVILNLVANARDAMPKGGVVTVCTDRVELDDAGRGLHPGAPPGDYVLLTVTDNGCGMDLHTRGRIFEPFFTTKALGRGTGLGLSSVYGIVKGHRGYIYCDSQLGRGTTFRIYLPRYEEQPPSETEREPDGGNRLSGGETVLLVDDEEPVLEASRELMEGFGYRVLTARSGEEALEVHGGHPDSIDLVILDLGMPGMGGLACLERLMARQPELVVLVASGYAFADQADQARSLGAAGFLPKPYTMDALLARVRRLLEGETQRLLSDQS